MGPDPEGYLAAIEDVCAEYDLQMSCITGNHEHWVRLDALWAGPGGQDADGRPAPLALSAHVTMLPRGHRWTLGGRTFVALGSAPSVNRHLLTEGVDWWPTEALLDEHVDAAIDGGHADVMLTHDSPASPYCVPPVEAILRRNVRDNPMGWPAASLAYADEGIARLTRAVLGIKPLLLAHGHFHVAGEDLVRLPGADHDTAIWALAARDDPGTVRLLDLDTLTDPA